MKISKKIVSRISNPKCEELLKSHGLDDLLPKIYAAREVGCVEDVHYTLKNLLPFNQLSGITESAKIIVDSIEKDDSIVILGDYDADGATSVAVSVSAFAMFGVKVNFIVPNRFKDGYGLTPEIINEAHEKYQAKLIISVDSGIRDLEGVDHANSLGMKVIITDHHIAGDVLPKAAAIVNPNMVENQDLAFKSMAGVGVAFYLMLGVRAELRKQDWFVMRDMQDPNMAELLDLVALGTIADVVKLDKNNRLMVFQGLLRIKRDKARVGVRALFAVTQRKTSEASSGDLAFALAPHINAAGRLQDISIGIKLLISNDPVEADELALQLHELNVERKSIELNMQKQALEIINNYDDSLKGKPMFGLCLYKEDWHNGVAGILAARMKEKYSCPVIILTKHSDTELKGSARSPDGFNVLNIIERIADKYPQSVVKYGGHKTAAGLTILMDDFETFSSEFSMLVKNDCKNGLITVNLESDGELPVNRLTIETAKMIRDAGPWGQGFAEPLFHGSFHLVEQRIVGQRHLKLSLQPKNGYDVFNAIVFNVDLDKWPNESIAMVNILYRLDVNEFRGFQNLQFIVQYIEPCNKSAINSAASKEHDNEVCV